MNAIHRKIPTTTGRTWATERRRFWPRAIKWVIAGAIWAILIGIWWGC